MRTMSVEEKQMLEALSSKTEEEVMREAMDDDDCPPLTDEQLASSVRARDLPGDTILEKIRYFKKHHGKKVVTIRFDADILDYYKSKGKGYQSMMNDALRACMEAEKEAMQA